MTKKEFHNLIQEVHTELLEEEKLKEGLLSWASGVARNVAYGIIDKRASYLRQAMQYDPKLQRLAKDLKVSNNDFQKRVTSLLDKDPEFLRALSSASYKIR